MIYLGGKSIKDIYLGNRPVSYVFLGDKQIWQSRVCMEAGAVIVLSCDAALSAADGVTYTVDAAGGALSCLTAAAVPGTDANNGAVLAVPVAVQPYMRHIAPTQTASPQTPLAETMMGLLPSERGGIAVIGGQNQDVTIVPADGNAKAAQHTGTGIQQSAPVAGHADILRDADCGVCPQAVNITSGAGSVLLNMDSSGGVIHADAIGGSGNTMESSHNASGMYRAESLNADGTMHGAGFVAGGGYDVDSDPADGRIYAAYTAAGAMPDITPMYGDADHMSAFVPVSAPWSELVPGYAGTLPTSCDHQTPTAAAELTGSYVGIRQAESAECAPSACAAAEPEGAASVPVSAFPTVGAIYTVCMITRVYINPEDTAFDAALVTEIDILALAEIDQMAIQN